MSIRDEIGKSKYHRILGPCKIAEENLINEKPGRVFVYAGDPDNPQIFHVAEKNLHDVCLKCDGEGIIDLGGFEITCDSCGGKGFIDNTTS